jgi:hypothetical protein
MQKQIPRCARNDNFWHCNSGISEMAAYVRYRTETSGKPGNNLSVPANHFPP